MSQKAKSDNHRRQKYKGDSLESQHLEDILDEALMETFPASDPVAISFPVPIHSAGSSFAKHTECDEEHKTVKDEGRHRSNSRRIHRP